MPLSLIRTVSSLLLFTALGGFSSADSNPVPGSQVAREVTIMPTGKKVSVRYWQFVPADYDGKKQFPLMLFLHGSGERGHNLELVKKWGPPRIVMDRPDFPFVLISPQCPEDRRWDVDELYHLMDHVSGSLMVDQQRLYVTGLSMGGSGAWHMMDRYPDLFAAGIPICGSGESDNAKNLVNIPIWAFHGGADNPSTSQLMIQQIGKAGGKKARLTVYPDVGHNSWSRTYANEGVYQWLLSKKSDYRGEKQRK